MDTQLLKALVQLAGAIHEWEEVALSSYASMAEEDSQALSYANERVVEAAHRLVAVTTMHSRPADPLPPLAWRRGSITASCERR